MNQRASQLAKYCRDRLGDQLRAVGYYAEEGTETTYVREDLSDFYGPDRIKRFVRGARTLHSDLLRLDEEMGRPEASLHVLTDGLVIQFHFGGEHVIFLAMERDVGRNFVQFIVDCQDHMT